jgi:hypothetical protein
MMRLSGEEGVFEFSLTRHPAVPSSHGAATRASDQTVLAAALKEGKPLYDAAQYDCDREQSS